MELNQQEINIIIQILEQTSLPVSQAQQIINLINKLRFLSTNIQIKEDKKSA
jgi:hypothetical protein